MKWTFPISLVLLVGMAIEPKAQTVHFNNSAVVPAAEGKVKVKKDNNNNYSVDLEIEHLAPPKKLSPPKDVYIVWIESGEGTKNLGRIHTGTGFLSGTLKGSFKTVTSVKPTKVFITAETEGEIKQPGTTVVLTTEPF